MTETQYAISIELPTDQVFRDLKHAKRCALDIGNYSSCIIAIVDIGV